ncbi:MAG: calcium/sodium antiporter [Spirochaetales bacterium]|nr:calcium/sodium antiporter [Spirochaetales bacterium]
MLIAILLFTLGLLCLIKGGDWFVDGATSIAERFHVPEILIGATVVSIGTTIPEVMVSATSAISGHGEIAYGNAIGSVICNCSLIAAITIAFRPSAIDRSSLKTPLIFFSTAALVYMVSAYVSGSFSRPVGFLLLALFVVYMILTIRQAFSSSSQREEMESRPEQSLAKNLLLLVGGAVLIAVGANLLVENGTIIAKKLSVQESVIALTFIALGTSLPELVTAITALVKGHSDLSLGNVIGANLFNLVLVSGLATVLSPFTLPQEKLFAGMNASLVIDIPVMLLVMLLINVPAMLKGRLYRIQGVLLLMIYTLFCLFQFLN